MSSPATPATHALPLRRLRDGTREQEISAADSVSFPELVWAHHLHVQELQKDGHLHSSAETEYREKLDRFVKENGRILNAYWCTSEASGVALTEKPSTRVAGFLWRRPPNIRLHCATDWVTRDAVELGHVLHTCETLGIRVGEVLKGTPERITMQWILAVAGYILGIVDQAKGTVTPQASKRAVKRARAELRQVEDYYDRVGEKTGRLVYFAGMMIGLALLAVPVVVYALTWASRPRDLYTPFLVCYGMGALGAVVSVMERMASAKEGKFALDYEVGRKPIRRVGSFRPVIGAIFAVVLYFSLRSGLIPVDPPKEGPGAVIGLYASLAFLAGFSERRAGFVLGGAQKVLGDSGDPAGDEDEPDSDAPSSTGGPPPARAETGSSG